MDIEKERSKENSRDINIEGKIERKRQIER